MPSTVNTSIIAYFLDYYSERIIIYESPLLKKIINRLLDSVNNNITITVKITTKLTMKITLPFLRRCQGLGSSTCADFHSYLFLGRPTILWLLKTLAKFAFGILLPSILQECRLNLFLFSCTRGCTLKTFNASLSS